MIFKDLWLKIPTFTWKVSARVWIGKFELSDVNKHATKILKLFYGRSQNTARDMFP